jgi:sugar phosphate isomerase/epimerase
VHRRLLCTFAALFLIGTQTRGAESAPPKAPRENPFFALCMDTHDAKQRSLAEQAQLLKELGYAGAGHLWLDQVPERLATLDAAGLALHQIYIRIDVAPDAAAPYDQRLKDVLPLLKGRPTMLAALMQGAKPSDETRDERAVALLREMAALAEPFGVKIALYPHANDWLEKVDDALRVARKTDRPNVGVMFNLCHWLRVEKTRDYAAVLARAGARLFAVTINGAEEFDQSPGWERYIQPLGRGSFDMYGFLKALRAAGYTGPVGLQCYGLPGDAREHLAASIKAWRGYMTRLAAEK